MEFHEKLRELRKSKGLTQEELAEQLYVSRTAVSKWESGRGYPGIDSLKEISEFFGVSIDLLLSGEKLLSIAEKEKSSGIKSICRLTFGIMDLLSLLSILLPLYPESSGVHVYSVNLIGYTAVSPFIRAIHWVLFLSLVLCGALKLLPAKTSSLKIGQAVTFTSLFIGIVTVLFLALTREAYAVTLTFMLLAVKCAMLLKCARM